MLTPELTVIVTVYNKEKYIAECIESIVNQTEKNLELILVNDGSTDSSCQIMNSYAKKHNNIRIINQNNRGLAEARITGFQEAKGKYISWVDADDFARPEMYQILKKLAEDNDADLVYCDYEFYPHAVSEKVKWFREYHGRRDWSYIDKNTEFWNKLFRRDLLDRVDIVDLLRKYGEYAPIAPMLESQNTFYTKEQLYVYRVGHDSMSGGSYDGKVNHYLEGVEISKTLPNMIKGKPYEEELKDYFEYRYIYTLLLLSLVSAKNKDKEHFLYAKRELERLHYKDNKYLDLIIKEHYGRLKSLVMTRFIPVNYYSARAITKLAMR